MADALSKQVTELAVDVLDSFEKLDILLRLERAAAPIALDVLVTDLGIDRPNAVQAVDELVAQGAVESTPQGYTIARRGRWAAHVRALVELHRTDRMEVVTIMSRASVERLRAQAARAFADAFLVRPPNKKGNDGDG